MAQKQDKDTAKEKAPEKLLSVCDASLQMISKARKEGISTAFDRAEAMKACPIGADGSCCKHCAMGPCRVPATKKGEEPDKVGVCGATPATIAARNFARMVAAGSSAHCDHARGVAEVFLLAAKGKIPGYGIKDVQKLLQLGMDFGLDVEKK
jgi:carbon-monoxide dehydrogenase catalytic subunit